MIHCIVKSNGYKQHIRGPFLFTEQGREVIVDASTKVDVDEPGKPLVLTSNSWDYVRGAAGRQLVIEPIEAGGLDAIARISELEHQLEQGMSGKDVAALRAQFDQAYGELQGHMAQLRADVDAIESERMKLATSLEQKCARLLDLDAENGKLRARVTELEAQQLAAKKK